MKFIWREIIRRVIQEDRHKEAGMLFSEYRRGICSFLEDLEMNPSCFSPMSINICENQMLAVIPYLERGWRDEMYQDFRTRTIDEIVVCFWWFPNKDKYVDARICVLNMFIEDEHPKNIANYIRRTQNERE